jgi:hypothetical protein
MSPELEATTRKSINGQMDSTHPGVAAANSPNPAAGARTCMDGCKSLEFKGLTMVPPDQESPGLSLGGAMPGAVAPGIFSSEGMKPER